LENESSRRHRGRSPWGTVCGLIVAAIGLGLIGWALVVQEDRAVDRDAQATREAMAAGRVAAAREPLRRWLRARPSSAEAHALMAELALAEGELDQVKPEFNQARSLGYPDAKLDRLLAISWARSGRFAEAEPILTRLFNEANGPDPAVDEALARIYLKTYRLSRARAAIRRWIDDAPSDGRPFLWLTEIDRRTDVDNPESWERHYREALRRDPDLDPARRGLAESLRRVHRNEEAAQEYAHYLARHPDDAVALAGAGLNALEPGNLSEATRQLDRALALAPDERAALRGRAEVDIQRGELASAARRLDQALERDPFDDEILHLRSQVRARLGDSAGARADREAFERLKKDHAALLQLRGRLLDHPEDSDTRLKVAEWMMSHGREEAGLEWAMAILANHPHHAPTCRFLADYYAKRPDGAGQANYYRLQADAQKPDR
jgi:type IV pilus assembly protein PilF